MRPIQRGFIMSTDSGAISNSRAIVSRTGMKYCDGVTPWSISSAIHPKRAFAWRCITDDTPASDISPDAIAAAYERAVSSDTSTR